MGMCWTWSSSVAWGRGRSRMCLRASVLATTMRLAVSFGSTGRGIDLCTTIAGATRNPCSGIPDVLGWAVGAGGDWRRRTRGAVEIRDVEP